MIGIVAACLTTFGFIPQAIKVIKTKDTETISLGMYVMSVTWYVIVVSTWCNDQRRCFSRSKCHISYTCRHYFGL